MNVSLITAAYKKEAGAFLNRFRPFDLFPLPAPFHKKIFQKEEDILMITGEGKGSSFFFRNAVLLLNQNHINIRFVYNTGCAGVVVFAAKEDLADRDAKSDSENRDKSVSRGDILEMAFVKFFKDRCLFRLSESAVAVSSGEKAVCMTMPFRVWDRRTYFKLQKDPWFSVFGKKRNLLIDREAAYQADYCRQRQIPFRSVKVVSDIISGRLATEKPKLSFYQDSGFLKTIADKLYLYYHKYHKQLIKTGTFRNILVPERLC